jgi:hypothetical protein
MQAPLVSRCKCSDRTVSVDPGRRAGCCDGAARSWRMPPSRHRRRGIAMCGRAILVVPEGERPHPWRPDWRRIGLEDAADDSAISEDVEIIFAPLAGRARSRGALENQLDGQPRSPAARPLLIRYETNAAHAPIMKSASVSSTFAVRSSSRGCLIPRSSLV